MNAQDVLRDVHDPSIHALKTTASLSASTVYVGNPTLYAVVNTGAAGDSTANIGFATVSISNPTLYAVVNTSAAGVGNSIVTVANPNFGVVGNVTLSDSKTYIGLTTSTLGTGTSNIGSVSVLGGTINASLNAGVNNIGFATVTQVNQPALVAGAAYIGLATVDIGTNNTVKLGTNTLNIGSVSVLGGTIAVSSLPALTTSTANIGSVSVLGGVINSNLNAGVAGIGFATVNVAAIAAGANYVGLASVNIGGTLPALSAGVANIGFATVTTTNPSAFSGNVTITDGKTYIGLVTATLGTGTSNIGSVSILGGSILANLNTGTLNIGSVSVLGGTINAGLNAGVNNIGFASVTPIAAWPDPHTYIGLVTITGSLSPAAGNITITDGKTFIGSVSVTGNVGLSAGVNGIGFATVNVAEIKAGANYVGLASVNIGGTLPALSAGVANIGFASVTPVAAWPDPKTYIGLVTITGALSSPAGNITITDGKTYIGLVTATLGTGTSNIGSVSILGGSILANLNTGTLNIGSVSVLGGTINANLQTGTLNIGSVSVLGGGIGINAGVNGIGFATVKVDTGTQFIGLVTAVTRNAGTLKTLLNLPITGLSKAGSIATIAVPTNANSIYITNLILNSDATVNVRIKSGVTYMNGNASLGLTLNPGGGFVMTGAPDSPSWIGLPSGALIIEKFDMTGTIANIGGNVVYFQE